MEVFTPPYYLQHNERYLTNYVECIYQGQKIKGKIVDCAPFLKYEIEYTTSDTKNTTTINEFQIAYDEKPESKRHLVDIDDEVMFTMKRGEKPIIGEVQKIFDHSYYTVELIKDHGAATFTRDKLHEITYKDYYELFRKQGDEPPTPDEKESEDSDFTGNVTSATFSSTNCSDSDEEQSVSENELRDITQEQESF